MSYLYFSVCVCARALMAHVAHVTLQPIYVLPPCTGNPNSNRIQYQAIFLSQPPPLSPLILHGVRAWVPNPSSGDGGWLVVIVWEEKACVEEGEVESQI